MLINFDLSLRSKQERVPHMGEATIFKCPRRLDRQVIESLKKIAIDTGLPQPVLSFLPFNGVGSNDVEFDKIETDPILKVYFESKTASIVRFDLISRFFPHDLWHCIIVERMGESLVDKVSLDWRVNNSFKPEQFARLICCAKQEFNEIKIDEVFKRFSNDEIEKYYTARDTTLTRLESVTTEIIYKTQEHAKSLDSAYLKKVESLNADLNAKRDELKKEYEAKEELLAEKELALKAHEAAYDMRESKCLRRQLRQDMLKKLADLNVKYGLTKETRRLRWPITVFTLIFLVFFGTMTVLSFSQTSNLINATGQDISKLSIWHLAFLSIKQLGFVAAFLAGAWFFIKWNDRWFRQHADAEFMFKQLELDINRASWVIEMACEWKDDKNHELPSELLDRLTRNLFKQPSQTPDECESNPELASVLLGSPANLKIKAPNGAEMEFDRKGLKNALK